MIVPMVVGDIDGGVGESEGMDGADEPPLDVVVAELSVAVAVAVVVGVGVVVGVVGAVVDVLEVVTEESGRAALARSTSPSAPRAS